MHELIIGPTMCGKTTLAKEKARAYLESGVAVLVLDPFLDDWPCTWKTTDRAAFIATAKRSRRCVLIMDEAGQTLSRDADGEWPFTVGRQWGHKSIVMAQGAKQLLPIQRDQCSTVYLFADADPDECDFLARKFNDPGLRAASTLGRHNFLMKRRGEPLRGPLKLAV